MLAFLYDYGLFLAKSITFTAMIVVIISLIASLKQKSTHHKGELELEDLSESIRETTRQMQHMLTAQEQKNTDDKNTDPLRHNDVPSKKYFWQFWKKKTPPETNKPTLFVIDFEGNIAAEAVSSLREEITAIVQVATAQDQVLIRLESPGGMVSNYGLAASQLARVKAAQIPLTVAIDKVAASGGYLMACVADQILAAPFAMVGSIGVVAQLPNLNRFLEKHDVDYEQFTAGEYKRTVTIFGKNTPEAREKFQSELNDVHLAFQGFVAEHRPAMDLAHVATGEHWLASQALGLGLVDQLVTSDSYLLDMMAQYRIIQVKYKHKELMAQKLKKFMSRLESYLLI